MLVSINRIYGFIKRIIVPNMFFFGNGLGIGLFVGICIGGIVKNWVVNIVSVASFTHFVPPSSQFISDSTAFITAILAFLIPLSFDVVSRTSERYGSGVLTRIYQRQFLSLLYPVVLIMTIILTLGVRLYVPDSTKNIQGWFWPFISKFIFIWIVFIAFYIVFYFKKLFEFINSDTIVTELTQDAKKFFNK